MRADFKQAKKSSSRNKFSHVGSGYSIAEEYQQSKLVKFVLLIPKILLGIAILFLLISLANPYLPKSTIEKIVESREIAYLFDVSSSKGWEFENTGKSAGELGRKEFLRFLNMRKGQNDRATLWLFADQPHLIEDFIIDDDILYMAAEDAPYLMVFHTHPGFPENDPEDGYVDIVAPRDRIQLNVDGGGTYLNPALDAIIKYFDREGNKKIKQKALIIETDAAIEDDAKTQLQELSKRNIKVYLLHIKPNELGETQFGATGLANSELLKNEVRQLGGKTYDIRDKKSLENAYRDIDRLEKAPVSLVIHLFKVFVYQRSLIVAIVLFFLAIVFGSIMDRYGENP